MDDTFSGILDCHIHLPSPQTGGLTGITIGFERGVWRCEIFSRNLFRKYLIDFALPYSEATEEMQHPESFARMNKAASLVYSKNQSANRGEFGELILHALIRNFFDTEPAISKIFFKDNPNDTVKGFDAVHVVNDSDNLELWLGEAKFYTDINKAIEEVIEELHKHTQTDYLRSEFAVILNKIDPAWPHSEKLKLLLDERISLDIILTGICIPVLLTYNSNTMKNYQQLAEKFRQKIEREINRYNTKFWNNNLPENLKIHLFLFPMSDKAELVKVMKKGLDSWQTV